MAHAYLAPAFKPASMLARALSAAHAPTAVTDNLVRAKGLFYRLRHLMTTIASINVTNN